MIDFALSIPAEISPLVGRSAGRAADGAALGAAEVALTRWLLDQQKRRKLPDESFARTVGLGASAWRRLRDGQTHYTEEFLYTLAGYAPDGLPWIADVARLHEGWSLYDTWLLWGAACLPPFPRPSVS